MKKKLSWRQIREWYAGSWVELVDFEWEWDRPTPSRAVVRNCSEDRAALLAMSRQGGTLDEAIILFVGPTPSLVRSPNAGDTQPVMI